MGQRVVWEMLQDNRGPKALAAALNRAAFSGARLHSTRCAMRAQLERGSSMYLPDAAREGPFACPCSAPLPTHTPSPSPCRSPGRSRFGPQTHRRSWPPAKQTKDQSPPQHVCNALCCAHRPAGQARARVGRPSAYPSCHSVPTTPPRTVYSRREARWGPVGYCSRSTLGEAKGAMSCRCGGRRGVGRVAGRLCSTGETCRSPSCRPQDCSCMLQQRPCLHERLQFLEPHGCAKCGCSQCSGSSASLSFRRGIYAVCLLLLAKRCQPSPPAHRRRSSCWDQFLVSPGPNDRFALLLSAPLQPLRDRLGSYTPQTLPTSLRPAALPQRQPRVQPRLQLQRTHR